MSLFFCLPSRSINGMPFGLCSAQTIFTELMSIVLQCLNHFAIDYLDGILMYSETLEQHKLYLEAVL